LGNRKNAYINFFPKVYIKSVIFSALAGLIISLIYYFRNWYKHLKVCIILVISTFAFVVFQSYHLYTHSNLNTFIIPFKLISMLGIFHSTLFTTANNSPRKNKVGVVYTRVSSKAQAEEGFSLQSQVDTMTQIANEMGIQLPFEPIVDPGVSGSNLKRENLEKILKLAEEGKITHILTIDIDRIGRNSIESQYYIHCLRELGVKIITRDGEIDLHRITDLVGVTIKSLVAQMESDSLVERTQRGKIQKFASKKWIKPIPIGYKKCGDWLEKLPQYTPLIKDVYAFFIDVKNYTRVCNLINERYGQILDKTLRPAQIKRILSDSVYIGKPEYGGKPVDAPELAFMDQAIFDRAREIAEKIKSRYRSANKKVVRVKDLVSKFGIHYSEKYLDIAILCPKCRTPMVKNGTKPTRGVWVNNYICPCSECKEQKQVPTGGQLDQFTSVKLLYCPHCGTPDDFTVEATGDLNKFTCRVCGKSFKCDEPGNKFMRYIRERQREKEGKDYSPIMLLRDEQITLADFELEAG